MATISRLLLRAVLLIIVIAAAWPLADMGMQTQALLSQHSRPAAHLPAKMVAIVRDGKLFHDPNCAYMHGHPRVVSAEEAAKLGYTPCTRCMREALVRR